MHMSRNIFVVMTSNAGILAIRSQLFVGSPARMLTGRPLARCACSLRKSTRTIRTQARYEYLQPERLGEEPFTKSTGLATPRQVGLRRPQVSDRVNLGGIK